MEVIIELSDDLVELMERAQDYTGIADLSELANEGLRSIIRREESREKQVNEQIRTMES